MASAPPALLQHWVHSHEDDKGGEMVFRPASYDFPLSRGRRSLDLRAKGELHRGAPGADDRPVTSQGSWTLDGKTLDLTGPGGAPEKFEIVSVTPEKLVLRQAG